MVDLDAIFSEMESRSTPDDSVLCVIDDNLRIVTVPSSGMVFGVEKDKDVNKIDFEMDRYYRDNDMSEFSARIYYQNAKGNKNYSTVTDLSFTEDKITFSWTVPAYALMYEGTIRFAVNFIKTSGSVVEKAFNTTIASANCLIGLYIDTQIPEKEFEDYLTHLKNEIKGYSDVQLAAIEDAKTEALTGIDDAEEEALLNIKQASPALPVITDSDFGKAVTVKSDASGLELSGPYAPIEVAVRPTVSGNPAVAEDSIAWKFQGLKIYGKSTQDGTPSPENPVPIVSAGDGGELQLNLLGKNLFDASLIASKTAGGATLTNNGDGSFTVSGTGQLSERFESKYEILKSDVAQLFTVGRVYGLRKREADRPTYPYFRMTIDGKTEAFDGFDLTKSILDNLRFIRLEFIGPAGSEIISGVVKPMVYQCGDNVWEPYKTPQSLTLSTPNGLPGIPVKSGGNFTDVNGQQLVCNYADFGSGKIKSRCLHKILSSSDAIGKNAGTYNQEDRFYWPSGYTFLGKLFSMCNRLTIDEWGTGDNCIGFGEGTTKSVYFRLQGITSVEEAKSYLDQNPIEFVAAIKEIIETDIPAEELAAYRALTTYDGTTVVSTAEPVAGIEVSYVADTQKYIDKKIEEAISKLNAAQQGEETNVSL